MNSGDRLKELEERVEKIEKSTTELDEKITVLIDVFKQIREQMSVMRKNVENKHLESPLLK